MANRLDVLTGREDEKSQKTYWTRIGAAFPTKDGKGWTVVLDALPVNGRMLMVEPKPKEDRQQPRGGASFDDGVDF